MTVYIEVCHKFGIMVVTTEKFVDFAWKWVDAI